MIRFLLLSFSWICIAGLVSSCVSSSKKESSSAQGLETNSSKKELMSEDLSEIPRRKGGLPGPYFDWPVDQARLTRGYFTKPPRGKSKRPHFGIDLAAPKNTSIYSAHDGTVIYVGREFRGFGRMVMIEGKGGWATIYAHLTKSRVKEGQQVRQGDLIGDMGRTGRATGVHLHFEIRKQTGPVDPLKFLPQSPRFAGLPAQMEEPSKLSAAEQM